ncbi:MAG TPA: NHL repeat-containing protein [Gaiellaceae bacterium]|nr:NHL repeat-containing protein [Gaiellaceae bacterium]
MTFTPARALALVFAAVGIVVLAGTARDSRSGALRLERPGALAVARDGTVYVADGTRVLAVPPSGGLRVALGGLRDAAGLAVAPDGTLYVADAGHGRVLALSPAGHVRRVVARGRLLWPAGLAFDPLGRLVVADPGRSQVVRVEADGSLTHLVGTPSYAGLYGLGGPAAQASADGAEALAYDGHGNLYLAGFNTKSLLRVTPAGILEPAGAAYPSAGGMTTLPDGRVLATDRDAVVRLTPHGPLPFEVFDRPVAGIEGFVATGIAAGPDGTLYLDTWPTGYSDGTATALVALRPDGSTRVLWSSR